MKKLLPGIETIPRHPIFELAEQTSVYIVNGRAYTKSEEGKKEFVEIGDFDSLDELLLNRASDEIEKLGKEYAEKNTPDFLKEFDGANNIQQLIYRKVFPYLRDNNYKERVSELLGHEKERKKPEEEKTNTPSKRVEKIADNILEKVNALVSQIEKEWQEEVKRDRKENKLDEILGQETTKYNGNSLLGKATNGRDMAIVDGRLYNLAEHSEGKTFVDIDGKRFSLEEIAVQTIRGKEGFEVGDRIRMNAGANEYIDAKEGSEGEILKHLENGRFNVNFYKVTGKNNQTPAIMSVETKYMESLEEIVEYSNSASLLEQKLLFELGKKIKTEGLKRNFSKEKLVEIVSKQSEEMLNIADKKEYNEDCFGFTQDVQGNYYVYIDFPAMAIKSETDGNYYLYDKTKIGIKVFKRGDGLGYESDIIMVKNNGHPYVHCKDPEFVEVCIGRARIPTSGKDTGEIIVKRLRAMKEVLMFGYSWDMFDPVVEGKEKGKYYNQYRKDLPELEKMGVPIIRKGDLVK